MIQYMAPKGYFTPYMYPVNTKHLYNSCTMLDQRRRRWADVVQMLYNCFVFTGYVYMHMCINILVKKKLPQ